MYNMSVSHCLIFRRRQTRSLAYRFHRSDLDENAREVRGSLYCPRCHHQLDLPVCAACRRVINDRVVSALGKQWHVEVRCETMINDKMNILIVFFCLRFSISLVHVVLNHFVEVNILNIEV